jgi:hypothetical protein
MANTLELTSNIGGLKDYLDTYRSDTAPKVVKYALLSIARKAQSAISDAVMTGYNVQKKSDLGYKTRFDSSDIAALISGPARRLNQYKFNPIQTDTGIDVTIKKGLPIDEPHGFIQKNIGSNSFSGVFIREPGAKRYPIKSLYGLSTGDLLKSDWIGNIVAETIAANKDELFAKKLASMENITI